MNTEISRTIPISVVIPCFRCADTIERSIDSVLSQEYLPAEVILVDDCSRDETPNKLEMIQRKYPELVRLAFLEENGGPGAARNKGWNIAREKYVAFLDADDTWHPLKLKIQYQWMEAHPEFILTGHACTLQDNVISVLDRNGREQAGDTFRHIGIKRLLLKNYFSTTTIMVRRNCEHRFRDDKKYCEDYLLAATVAASGHSCAVSYLPLSILHKEAYGAGGLSGSLWRMWNGELQVYAYLYKIRAVSLLYIIPSVGFSALRFARRCCKVGLRRLKATLTCAR